VDVASRADSGQWQFTSAKFCCPPNESETKRESREARSGYRITCPRGIRGWPACEDRDRTRAIEPRGIPQDVDAVRERTLISRMHLTQTYNSLYLLLNTFSLRPFVLQIKPISHAFLSFFYRCTTLEYFFIFFEFNYLHRNLTLSAWRKNTCVPNRHSPNHQ
jgi:hypothetical protein